MRKVFQIIGISALTCFSFYYTNQLIELSKMKDPLMTQIVNNQEDFNVYAMESIIYDDYVLSGSKGEVIDIEESYKKMKNLGKYNENLLVYEEDLPSILLQDTLDKFIVGVNTNKYDISLIFKVVDEKNISEILEVLNNNNVKANFFIDGKVIEEHPYIVNSIIKNEHYISNLGYDGSYSNSTISHTNDLLKKYSDYNIKYCYAKDLDYEILNICKKNKMNTIKPKYNYDTYLYNNIKNDLEKGSIYSLETNNYILEELDITLKYIKQKGFTFKKLDEFFI